ncbi:MAG TPA: hypothetical protein VN616_06335, partial [Puia sp.]|nr:hypothetical protein [Puia sp.]
MPVSVHRFPDPQHHCLSIASPTGNTAATLPPRVHHLVGGGAPIRTGPSNPAGNSFPEPLNGTAVQVDRASGGSRWSPVSRLAQQLYTVT